MRTRVERRTVNLSAYPDLVVIYLGMRVNRIAGIKTLLGFGPKISSSAAAQSDGLLRHETIINSPASPQAGLFTSATIRVIPAQRRRIITRKGISRSNDRPFAQVKQAPHDTHTPWRKEPRSSTGSSLFNVKNVGLETPKNRDWQGLGVSTPHSQQLRIWMTRKSYGPRVPDRTMRRHYCERRSALLVSELTGLIAKKR